MKFMAICAGVCMVSCGSGKKMLSVSALDGEWAITEVNGQKVEAEQVPFIGFDVEQKRMYGNSGCNRMMGTFEADSLNPGQLKFGAIGSTRMMCPDMETETKVLEALDGTKRFSMKGGIAYLLDENGSKLLTLKKR